MEVDEEGGVKKKMGIKGKRWSVDETFEGNPVLGEMDGNIKMCDALSFCARQKANKATEQDARGAAANAAS